LKVVDFVEKSEKIEVELTQILSNIIDFGQALSILTPSYLVNYFKVYPVKDSVPTEVSLQNGSSIKYSNSFANLLSKYLDQAIFIKVNFLNNEFIASNPEGSRVIC